MVYLDFSKAFDRVPKHRLVYKLDHLGVRGRLLRCIGSFLSNRALLFIAYTAYIKEKIISPFAMFADDIKLYNTCSNYNTLVQDLQAIYNWSQEWLLSLNVQKCVTLHVGSKNPRLVYSVGNKVLSSTGTHNDLGVLITNDLSWSDHAVSVVYFE